VPLRNHKELTHLGLDTSNSDRCGILGFSDVQRSIIDIDLALVSVELDLQKQMDVALEE
jgi:hypothetical protein